MYLEIKFRRCYSYKCIKILGAPIAALTYGLMFFVGKSPLAG